MRTRSRAIPYDRDHPATYDREFQLSRPAPSTWSDFYADVARFIAPLGRAFFAAVFLGTVQSHFSSAGIAYAGQQGVPAPEILVPLSGVLAIAGGLSILLGYHARIGAWLLVLFLVPVTLMMHNFWAVDDPMQRMNQMAHFMKNLALIGGALTLARCGSGAFSLDNALRR